MSAPREVSIGTPLLAAVHPPPTTLSSMHQPPSIAVVVWISEHPTGIADSPTRVEGQSVRPDEVMLALGRGGRESSGVDMVALAREHDIVAFTSDRMSLDPQWLERLLKTFEQTTAAAVGGPVRHRCTGSSPADPVGPSMLLADGRTAPAFVSQSSAPVAVDLLSPENMAIRTTDLGTLDHVGRARSARDAAALVLRMHKKGLTVVCAPEATAVLEDSDGESDAGSTAHGHYHRVREHTWLLVSGLGARDVHVWRYGAAVLRFGFHELTGALGGYRTRRPQRTMGRLAAASLRAARALLGYVVALSTTLPVVRKAGGQG